MSALMMLLLLASCLVYAAAQGACPKSTGRFAAPGQCDKYMECEDGEASEKLCPDGLVFDPSRSVFSYPCHYPSDVDCSGREALQPPKPSGDCPHQFGYFRVGSSTSECGQFMNCADGRSYTFDCPEGLAFNELTNRCDWPDEVPTCDTEAFLGFSCPQEKIGPLGPAGFYRSYRSPNGDCSRYFVCLEGRPRLMRCGGGQAYSEEAESCVDAENVPGCFSPSNNDISE